MSTIVALLCGPDRPGLVADVASWIRKRGGNILHADQHRDGQDEVFFQRLEWTPADPDAAYDASEAFRSFVTEEIGMEATVHRRGHRPRVVLMVSKTDHCLHELCLRFQASDLPGRLVGVISNHSRLEPEAHRYGLNFHHTPIDAQTKAKAEADQLSIIRNYGADLVVMARYMQILSNEFLQNVNCPVINIHHSFLPAFAGGKPYHQAWERGVKIIGATAHYATADLDDGPIIHQDVTRISHRHAPADLIRRGRDLEKLVLAHAVRLHLEHRILVYRNKTIVFDN